MGITEVALQLKEKCPCYSETKISELEVMAEQLVDNISLFTCWSTEACETLLYSDREERIPMPCLTCDCCGNIERFRPYFQYGIKKEDVIVSIVTQSGLETTTVEVSDDHFGVTNVKGYTEFLVNLEAYSSYCDCNNCDLMYVVFNYKAGYEKLPDCLFPQVCEIAKTITASTLGCGGLDDCCEMDMRAVGSVLKSKKLGEISRSWETDTSSFAYLFNQLLIANRFKSLSMISLCGTSQDDYRSRIWAVRSGSKG